MKNSNLGQISQILNLQTFANNCKSMHNGLIMPDMPECKSALGKHDKANMMYILPNYLTLVYVIWFIKIYLDSVYSNCKFLNSRIKTQAGIIFINDKN